MKTIIISTLMLLLPGLLAAQQTFGKPGAAAASTGATTWGGLRFGMTEAEAKLALKGKMVPAGPDDQPVGLIDVYSGGMVNGLELHDLKGSASLFFNKKSKKLVSVFVFFTPSKLLQEQSPTVGLVRDEFVKKYGSPTLSRGLGPDGCDERISDSCEIIFHSAGQSIHIHIMVAFGHGYRAVDHLFSIEVTYEPLGANSAI